MSVLNFISSVIVRIKARLGIYRARDAHLTFTSEDADPPDGE